VACTYGNCNDANCVAGDTTDVNGNPCDDASCAPCGSTPIGSTSSSTFSGLSQFNNTTSAAVGTNPVAAQATSPATNGGTSLSSSLLGFFSSVAPSAIKAATGAPSSGIVYQLNPATGTYQYYNTATGTYSPTNPTATTGISGIFSGSSSWILVVVALVVAFFAFGGRKKIASAASAA
jgi:hypothetical protein